MKINPKRTRRKCRWISCLRRGIFLILFAKEVLQIKEQIEFNSIKNFKCQYIKSTISYPSPYPLGIKMLLQTQNRPWDKNNYCQVSLKTLHIFSLFLLSSLSYCYHITVYENHWNSLLNLTQSDRDLLDIDTICSCESSMKTFCSRY